MRSSLASLIALGLWLFFTGALADNRRAHTLCVPKRKDCCGPETPQGRNPSAACGEKRWSFKSHRNTKYVKKYGRWETFPFYKDNKHFLAKRNLFAVCCANEGAVACHSTFIPETPGGELIEERGTITVPDEPNQTPFFKKCLIEDDIKELRVAPGARLRGPVPR